MSIKISPEMFSNAVEINPTGNIQILKDTIDLKLLNNGSVMKDEQTVGLLNLGNKGDNCVTRITFEVPDNFKPRYQLYWLVELTSSIYIQKAHFNEDTQLFEVWVDDILSFNVTNNNMLLALIEKEVPSNDGNVLEQQEIFVSNEFMGYIEDNFLNSGWNGSLTPDENLYVIDSLAEENPTEYHDITWVNGETKLNAANMNNIMLGINGVKGDTTTLKEGVNKLKQDTSTLQENSVVREVNINLNYSELKTSIYNLVTKVYSESDKEDLRNFINNKKGKILLNLTLYLDGDEFNNTPEDQKTIILKAILIPSLGCSYPRVGENEILVSYETEIAFYAFPIGDNNNNNLRFQLTSRNGTTSSAQEVHFNFLTLPIESVSAKVDATINEAIEQEY